MPRLAGQRQSRSWQVQANPDVAPLRADHQPARWHERGVCPPMLALGRIDLPLARSLDCGPRRAASLRLDACLRSDLAEHLHAALYRLGELSRRQIPGDLKTCSLEAIANLGVIQRLADLCVYPAHDR